MLVLDKGYYSIKEARDQGLPAIVDELRSILAPAAVVRRGCDSIVPTGH